VESGSPELAALRDDVRSVGDALEAPTARGSFWGHRTIKKDMLRALRVHRGAASWRTRGQATARQPRVLRELRLLAPWF